MRKSFIFIITVAVILWAGAVVWAANGSPGSAEDPVVSKSYVDTRASFAPLQLFPGQTLTGGEGAEIIIRSGEATAIGNEANGLSDLTAGADLMTGSKVELNHLLLVPRGDGRGITALTEAWIMIRGNYTIQ